MKIRKTISLIIILAVVIAGCGRKAEISPSINIAVDDNYRNYYEVFVYSFYDSDGDGIGDLKGVEEKLDYIAELGCNGIWLMPVMPSTTYHKYDVCDYMAIDEQYGTIEDYESLIKAAHDKHIRVIIDLVINHTSSKHPWFIQATEYLKGLDEGKAPDSSECPYVDYYHFAKEKKDNTWYQIEGTPYYYEGSFWSEMPDLNLANEALMKELKEVAGFWIDKGTDGFRMDAPLHYEESDTAFNTKVLNSLYEYCIGLDSDFYMVSEVWASEKTIEDYYKSATPSMFDFSFAQAEGDIIKAARGRESSDKFVDNMIKYEQARKAVNPDCINAPFITNHDMPRVSNALNGKLRDMKMAASILLSMNGSPYIYYGEELGMSSKGTKDENKRLPMMWSSADSRGICKDPYNADRDIEQRFDPADIQRDDETSLYNHYKKGLQLRNRYPEIARGDSVYEKEWNDESIDVTVISRTWNDETIYIAYNYTDKEGECGVFLDKISEIFTMSSDGEEAEIMESNEGMRIRIPAKSIVYLKPSAK